MQLQQRQHPARSKDMRLRLRWLSWPVLVGALAMMYFTYQSVAVAYQVSEHFNTDDLASAEDSFKSAREANRGAASLEALQRQQRRKMKRMRRPLRGLVPGWIPGRLLDLRDHQWRMFREQLPLLLALGTAFVCVSRLSRWAAKDSVTARLTLYGVLSFAYLFHIHGAFALMVMGLAVANFSIAMVFGGSSLQPLFTWLFNLAVMLLNPHYEQYTFTYLLGPDYRHLDRSHGLIQWYLLFNLCVLRMISFNMDFYWAMQHATDPQPLVPLSEQRGEKDKIVVPTVADREKLHAPLASYNFLSYFSYLFYIPLHLAGPILSFNAFISQVSDMNPKHSVPLRRIVSYGVRVALTVLLLEVWLHYMYTFAISHGGQATRLSPSQLAYFSVATLLTMQLKFTVIWRVFRLWALADGVECHENMQLCILTECSVVEFWKRWHASFNRWLVRYIYVPLGGSRVSTLRQSVNVGLVFMFVAAWHDQELKLFTWAVMLALFFVPELVARYMVRLPTMRRFRESRWFVLALVAASGLQTSVLIASNIIGYNVGVDGAIKYCERMFPSWQEGVWFGVQAWAMLAAINLFSVHYHAARLGVIPSPRAELRRLWTGKRHVAM